MASKAKGADSVQVIDDIYRRERILFFSFGVLSNGKIDHKQYIIGRGQVSSEK